MIITQLQININMDKINIDNNAQVNQVESKNEAGLSCYESSKCFSRPGQIKKHIGTHTGERPYECDECGKCFAKQTC